MIKYTVYALTEPDSKETIKYIGCTKMKLLRRLGHHLGNMNRNIGRKDKWLNSLNEAPFIIPLFEFNNSKEAFKKEKELIIKYEVNGVTLLNENSNYNRNFLNNKKVYQYDLKGNFIKEYESGKEAEAINMFFKYKCINACCNGSKKSHYGFMFSFDKKDKIKPFKRIKTNQGKTVYQYSLNNVFIKEFSCSREASNLLNISNGDIWKVCNNYKNAKTCGGFKWSYDKV